MDNSFNHCSKKTVHVVIFLSLMRLRHQLCNTSWNKYIVHSVLDQRFYAPLLTIPVDIPT